MLGGFITTTPRPRHHYATMHITFSNRDHGLRIEAQGGQMDKPYQSIITIDPAIRGGKPIIRGLRYTVYDILSYLAAGMSPAEILADFPDLTEDDIHACLSFAADRERQVMIVAA
jgi:uncharacterized protein (DUF433 family)